MTNIRKQRNRIYRLADKLWIQKQAWVIIHKQWWFKINDIQDKRLQMLGSKLLFRTSQLIKLDLSIDKIKT